MDKKKEVIPQGLVQAAESILVDANLNTNEFFGDFESTRTLTEDGMYLVTTFKIIPKKEEVKKEAKPVDYGTGWVRVNNMLQAGFTIDEIRGGKDNGFSPLRA